MASVSSATVVQSLLGLFPDPSYLEIGIAHGVTFHGVQAPRKVAVDPYFAFTGRPDIPPGCTVEYHEMGSDDYFGGIVEDQDRFDVIFIDGLHTFEQTLRDLLNALDFLAWDGVIVIDDVRPTNYPASLPEMPDVHATRTMLNLEHDHSWMGDVYKLVFFIESFLQQFSFATIEDNLGQLVLWRQRRLQVEPRLVNAIAQLQFMHCATQRDVFRLMPFDAILALVKAARTSRVDG
jgi:hypothetical protein